MCPLYVPVLHHRLWAIVREDGSGRWMHPSGRKANSETAPWSVREAGRPSHFLLL